VASYRAQGFTSYREVVKAEVHNMYCDVRELIDHVISESTEAYRGTARENDFLYITMLGSSFGKLERRNTFVSNIQRWNDAFFVSLGSLHSS